MAAEFTTDAWDGIQGCRDAIETMPFIVALADGSLPTEAFAFYLAQDAIYLGEFARALTVVARAARERPGILRRVRPHRAGGRDRPAPQPAAGAQPAAGHRGVPGHRRVYRSDRKEHTS